MHDFAYGDLVFDGREPKSFLATPGAKDVGVELFSMSKSYGMAGWRVGFVVGNAEIVERINLLNDHCRVGIFRPIQEACIAALTGPQDSVAERRDTYQRRRDRVREVLEPLLGPLTCEGTFYIWLELPEGVTFETLLTEHRVVLAPGEGFGPSGVGRARLSLAVDDETLELGLERLATAFSAAGRPARQPARRPSPHRGRRTRPSGLTCCGHLRAPLDERLLRRFRGFLAVPEDDRLGAAGSPRRRGRCSPANPS